VQIPENDYLNHNAMMITVYVTCCYINCSGVQNQQPYAVLIIISIFLLDLFALSCRPSQEEDHLRTSRVRWGEQDLRSWTSMDSPEEMDRRMLPLKELFDVLLRRLFMFRVLVFSRSPKLLDHDRSLSGTIISIG
jgi:hypothetical protein